MSKRTLAHDANPGTQNAIDHIWEDIEKLEYEVRELSTAVEGTVQAGRPEEEENPEISHVIDDDIEFNGTVTFNGTVDIAGTLQFSSQLLLFAGTVAAPGLGWADDPDSGWYRHTADTYRHSIAGVASHQISQHHFFVFSDASGLASGNYEALQISKESTANAKIQVVKGGTGTYRGLEFWTSGLKRFSATSTGHLKAEAGSTFRMDAGTAAAPGFTIVGDLDTGLYSSAANNLDLTLGGERCLTWGSDGTNFTTTFREPNGGNTFVQQMHDSGYMYMYLDGATNQNIYIRNLTLGQIRLGTNSTDRWVVESSGHISPVLSNTYDIGNATNKVKNFHTQGDVYVNGVNRGQIEGDETIFMGNKGTDPDIVSSVLTDIAWAARYDPRGWISAPDTTITPDIAGNYVVILQSSMSETLASGYAQWYIYKNTTVGAVSTSAAGGWSGVTVTYNIYLNGTTDYIKAVVYHTAGVNRLMDASRTFITVRKCG
jgi:cytoskeletal protein CcmA (bactofilin family)